MKKNSLSTEFGIKEQKRTRQQIEEFLDFTPDAIVAVDQKGSIVLVNHQTEKLFGYTRKELIGSKLELLLPERFKNTHQQHRTTYFQDPKVRPMGTGLELFGRKKDGVEFPVEISLSPYQTGAGIVAISAIRDITERRKAEEERKKMQQRMEGDITERKRIEDQNLKLSIAVEQSPSSIIITNYEGEIEYVNPKFLKLTGYSINEVLGKNPRILKSGERDSASYKKLWETIKSGSEWHGEFHNKKKNGELFWEWSSISPIKDSSGKITHFIAIKEDITEVKEAEESLKKITNDLIQHNKNLEQFAYIVSHNLRAPAANIIGISDALQNVSLSDNEKNMMMQGLFSSVKRLDEVILDLNHILQMKREVNEKKELVHFTEILNDIKSSISNLIKKEEVEIKSDFTEVDEILSLKSYIYSIFYNLISNSIKYRRSEINPLIEIKSRKSENKIELIFKDNGMGIDLHKKGDQVFGLYKRFHTHTEGKGLGLFMTKIQVETLSGKIRVNSELNKGTEFKIEFDV